MHRGDEWPSLTLASRDRLTGPRAYNEYRKSLIQANQFRSEARTAKASNGQIQLVDGWVWTMTPSAGAGAGDGVLASVSQVYHG